MSANKIIILTAFMLVLSLFGGCKEISPSKPPPANEPPISPIILETPGNAKRVLGLAKQFASGQKTGEELADEFDKLSDTQINQLAEKTDGDENFIHLLSKGVASNKVVAIADKFLNKINPTVMARQLAAKSGGSTAFENLRRMTTRDGSPEDFERNKLLALLVVADPRLVNQLQGANNAFLAEEFDAVIAAIDLAKMDGVAQVIDADNIKEWLSWAISDLDPTIMGPRLLHNFSKLYAKAGTFKQPIMRNFLLQKAYQIDASEIAAGRDALVINFILSQMNPLGLGARVGSDVYQLEKNPATGGKHSGSFLYVLTKRIIDDRLAATGLGWKHLREISGKVKPMLGTAYVNHLSGETFGAPPETILASVRAVVPKEHNVKLYLNLAIEPNDIYLELKALATELNLADRKVSDDLSMLLQDFKRDHGDLDAIANLVVPAADDGLGSLHSDDKFIHVLAELSTDQAALELWEYLVDNLSNRVLVLGEDSLAGRSALRILTDNGRDAAVMGGEHEAIIKLLLTQILEHGDRAALAKAFRDMDENSSSLLASFAYESRSHAINGGGTIGSIFATEYNARAFAADKKTLARALIETAFKDGEIGNNNNGIVTIIANDFLPLPALEERGYELFGAGAHVGINNTLLYEILLNAAASKIVSVLGIAANTDKWDPANSPQWRVAWKALNSRVWRGNSPNMIRFDAGALNLFRVNAAMAAFAGSLNQPEVNALVQAFKAKIPAASWNAFSTAATNSSNGAQMVWKLLEFTIAGGAIVDENTARAAEYLDY
jgi:hypothetical protein